MGVEAAGGSSGSDHPLELPSGDDHPQSGPGSGGGMYCSGQAGGTDATDQKGIRAEVVKKLEAELFELYQTPIWR
jgi:hypothetical protein